MMQSQDSPDSPARSAKNLDEVRQAIATLDPIIVRGGGTKPACSSAATLCTRQLSGVLKYEPSEFTFTALANTPIRTIEAMLDEHGQFLPFDPPFASSGATLAGTVACGLSGPGRFRYGGIRDFLLGVQLVTRSNRIVFGGAKVVKNAAGFDLPKLMVGCVGSFGVMTELTFKVFPRPELFSTLLIDYHNSTDAIEQMLRLGIRPFDLTCLDLVPRNHRLAIRLGGNADSLPARVRRIESFVSGNVTIIDGDEEQRYWTQVSEFDWLAESERLVKIPLMPSDVSRAEELIGSLGADLPRRYSVGGNALWLGWPRGESHVRLEGLCLRLKTKALCVTGHWPSRFIPFEEHNEFADRISACFR